MNKIKELRASGTHVEIVLMDISDQKQVEDLVQRLHVTLKGIMQAAGILDDGVLLTQQWDRFERFGNHSRIVLNFDQLH